MAFTRLVASLNEIRISTWPGALPMNCAFSLSISRIVGSDETIVNHCEWVRSAVVFIPFNPMTVYERDSPVFRCTGLYGASSQTAFQLIPARTVLTNESTTRAAN